MVMRTMRARAKWIMGIVAVAFVGWMVFEVGMDATGRGQSAAGVIARVNGRTIDATTFYAALRNEQERRRQQELPVPATLEEQRQLEDFVLDQLVQDLLLGDELRRRGITVTDQEVIQAARTSPPPEVMDAPQFHTDGQFDLQKYQRFVSSAADPTFLMALEARYRDELPRIKLYEQVTAGVLVSDAALWREYRDRNDSVLVSSLQLLPQTAVSDSVAQASEEEIATYYRDRRTELERPATAYLSFVAVPRLPDAADTAAALERAAATRREIADGADFADVAARESSDSASRATGGDLGVTPRGRFVSEFESAALALRPGQLSEPVLSPFGYHVIRLEASTDTSLHARHVLIPIEPVGDHLTRIESQADTLDLFAAEQESPTALDDVARRLDLPVAQAPAVQQGDRLTLGRYLVGDASLWAFGGPLAGETSPVIETEHAYYVFRLDSLRPAGVPPLAQIADEVRRLAQIEKRRAALRRLADTIAAELRAGATLEAVAESRGFGVRRLGPFTRYSPAVPLQGTPEGVGAAFGLGVGETGGPIHAAQGTFFLRPDRKWLADSTAFVAQLETLRLTALRRARQERVQLVLASLREQATVRDQRQELERLQREAERNPIRSPLGF